VSKIKTLLPDVQGRCPMGCGETLFLGSGGYITCSWFSCPRPDAASLLLEEMETDHIAEFAEDDTFTILHPLRERLERELMACPLHTYLVCLAGPPVVPGRYRASYLAPPSGPDGTGWEFEKIQESEITND
jgi:Family of unknown function (DUF6085)